MSAGKISGAKLSGGVIVRGIFTASPQDFYADLDFWWDFLDASNYTLNGGTNYSAVNDKGPNNRDLAQATGSLQPIFLSNVGAQFVDDEMQAASLVTSSSGTLFIVVRIDRTNNAETFISQGRSTIVDGDAFGFRKEPNASAFGNNVLRAFYNVSANSWYGNSSINDTTTFRVLSIRTPDRSLRIGTANETVTTIGATKWFADTLTESADRLMVGRSAGSSAVYGRVTIKEMFAVNRPLTNQEVVRLVNGLNIKYSL